MGDTILLLLAAICCVAICALFHFAAKNPNQNVRLQIWVIKFDGPLITVPLVGACFLFAIFVMKIA